VSKQTNSCKHFIVTKIQNLTKKKSSQRVKTRIYCILKKNWQKCVWLLKRVVWVSPFIFIFVFFSKVFVCLCALWMCLLLLFANNVCMIHRNKTILSVPTLLFFYVIPSSLSSILKVVSVICLRVQCECVCMFVYCFFPFKTFFLRKKNLLY